MIFHRITCSFCGYSWDADDDIELCLICRGLEVIIMRRNNQRTQRHRESLKLMLTATWNNVRVRLLSLHNDQARAVRLTGPDIGKLVEFGASELAEPLTHEYRHYLPNSSCFHELSEPEQLRFVQELQETRYREKLEYRNPRIKAPKVETPGSAAIKKLSTEQLRKLKELLG